MSSNESTPNRRLWFWWITGISIFVFVLAVVYGAFVQPLMTARHAVRRLELLGAEVQYRDFDDSSPLDQLVKSAGQGPLALNVKAVGFSPKSRPVLNDTDLSLLTVFPRLENLNLLNQPVTSRGLKQLTGMKLDFLSLAGSRVGSGCDSPVEISSGLAPVAQMQDLEWIDLSRTCVRDSDLATLSALRKLYWISLIDTRVTSGGIAHVAKVSNLKMLFLDGTDVDDEIGTQLAAAKSLMRLELSRTKLTGRGLEKLAGPGLRLELQESALNDEGLKCLGRLPGLCWLNLSQTHVTPEGLKHLQAPPLLSRLIMQGDNFGDEHLAAIAGCAKLSELDLRETHVTSTGIRLVERLTALRTLSVEGEVLNDPQSVESIRRCSNLVFLTARVDPGQSFDQDQVEQGLGPEIRLYVTEESGPFPQERVLRRTF